MGNDRRLSERVKSTLLSFSILLLYYFVLCTSQKAEAAKARCAAAVRTVQMQTVSFEIELAHR